jgi:flavin reductase (DIM6/NTAB) family NADH-FMN oxidoreductase RutF
MKTRIPLSNAIRLINPGPVVLVTSRYEEVFNVMTAAWTTPISHDPPLVGVSISPDRFTHALIEKGGEFVLNVPGLGLAKQVKFCGTCSGRETDKFKEAGLTPVEAELVSVPLVDECLGHLECKVVHRCSLGDHTLFVGQVVAAHAKTGTFDQTWLLEDREARPLHHLGGVHFGALEERITVQG